MPLRRGRTPAEHLHQDAASRESRQELAGVEADWTAVCEHFARKKLPKCLGCREKKLELEPADRSVGDCDV